MTPETALRSETGAYGLNQSSGYVREEWDPRFTGSKFAKVVRELVDSSATIGGFMHARSSLIRQAPWEIERPNDKPDARFAEEHATSCLGDMDRPFPSYIYEIMTFGWFGWDVHEVVFKVRRGEDNPSKHLRSKYSDGLIGFARLGHRAQETLLRWEFDDTGDAIAMIQQAPPDYRLRRIDLSRCLHVRPQSWKNSPEGRSPLRPVMRDWHYVKRNTETEAIGIQRDLAGTLIAEVPPQIMMEGATPAEKAILATIKTFVQRADRNEYGGTVYPAPMVNGQETGYGLRLMTSGGSRQIDTDVIIRRGDTRMLMAVLGQPLIEGQDDHGSYSLVDAHSNLMALGFGADMDAVCEDFTQGPLATLSALIGCPPDCAPRLKHGDIETPELTQMANFVSQLIAAKALDPDEKLQAFLRKYGGLPIADVATRTAPVSVAPAEKPMAKTL